MKQNVPEREDRAVDALMAAALRMRKDDEVPDAEINEYLTKDVQVTGEEEKALARIGENLSRMARGSAKDTVKQPRALAVHRKKPKKGFSAKTEKELQRLREQFRKNKNRRGK